ncbi:hypothetical protein DPMN_119277 [Dreissena polymorpha]|uniref:Uncharacterized protein n=1 Tax=Dreissena polymorpha TaxID=45954 RepID=A0A9D4GJ10_DREPO|nr:hypothetical protein DPMN_119277 [Dreissena polymorpha]
MDTVLRVSNDSAISSANIRQISRVSSSETCLRLRWLRRDEVVIAKTSSSSLGTCRGLFLVNRIETSKSAEDEDEEGDLSAWCWWYVHRVPIGVP